MTEINFEELNVSTVDSKPVIIESWHPEHNGEYVDLEDGLQWWEAFTYEATAWRDEDTEFTLIACTGRVIGLVHEGTFYDEWDEYESEVVDPLLEDLPQSTQEASMADQFADEDAEEPSLPMNVVWDEREWNNLMELDPSQWGSEGPMMNYWYPLGESASSWSRFSPTDAAMRLGVSSLTVVEVGGNYGLALAGGGMDFSWEICEAFVTLGYCPPVHFADLPRLAMEWGGKQEMVYRGMRRSIDWLTENLKYRSERLEEMYASYHKEES